MTQVKICGLTTRSALEAALSARADYVGLVFYPKSPRNVAIEAAGQLADVARGRTKIVALVVDAGADLLTALRTDIRPDIVQLHGKEGAQDIKGVRQSLPDVGIWKAVPVATRADVDNAATLLRPGALADMILFDAKSPEHGERPGGNGLSFDWRILSQWPQTTPFALAGGLTPDNVGNAISLTQAAIVDVSSGVETAPGIKSNDLIKAFVARAKAAGAETRHPQTAQ